MSVKDKVYAVRIYDHAGRPEGYLIGPNGPYTFTSEVDAHTKADEQRNIERTKNYVAEEIPHSISSALLTKLLNDCTIPLSKMEPADRMKVMQAIVMPNYQEMIHHPVVRGWVELWAKEIADAYRERR